MDRLGSCRLRVMSMRTRGFLQDSGFTNPGRFFQKIPNSRHCYYFITKSMQLASYLAEQATTTGIL